MKDKIMFKKILAVVIALVMTLTVTACAGEKKESSLDDSTTTQTDVALEPSSGSEDGEKERAEFSLDDCAAMLQESIPEPTCGSVGGEWVAFGLARWGGEVPQEWFDSYYEQVEEYVINCEGLLNERKYTEYSRVILALTAIGKDPTDVGGYNLLVPLADYEQTIFQGINGPIFALLALDSGSYEIPENVAGTTQATRELYLEYILDAECPAGGWTLAGSEADVDITAMALQALAKYQDRQDVSEAIDRALTVLSELQNDEGGFSAYGSESSESISQVITALAELGISIDDSRFVKNGNTLKDRLLDFLTEDGGFRHILDGESDLMATEQAFYALVALERMERGENSLYDMTDVQ